MADDAGAQAPGESGDGTPRGDDRFARRRGSENNKLVVGPDVVLKGANIGDCETVVIEGSAEASVECGLLRIARGGAFNGAVEVDNAEIAGRFEGDMTVHNQLTVHSGGSITGTLRYASLAVEAGGRIAGSVEALPASPRQETHRGERTRAVPSTPRPVLPEPLVRKEPIAHPMKSTG